MAFVATLSNEEVSALPAVQFDGEIIVVDTPQRLDDACQYLAKQRQRNGKRIEVTHPLYRLYCLIWSHTRSARVLYKRFREKTKRR